MSIGIPTADGVRSHGKEASKLTADCTSDSGPETNKKTQCKLIFTTVIKMYKIIIKV